jgi:hypothetical protein
MPAGCYPRGIVDETAKVGCGGDATVQNIQHSECCAIYIDAVGAHRYRHSHVVVASS